MKNKNFQDELRYEKKWIYRNNNYLHILNALMRSKLKFKYHFENRTVNTIYFDDFNLSSIRDNIEGQKNRLKYRLRWYGLSDKIVNPVFETKYKIALKTYKKKKNLKIKYNIGINNLNSLEKKIDLSSINNNILKPKILISYERTYLISSNNLVRATIDNRIKYKKLDKFNFNFFHKFNNIIVEMKYDINLDNYFRSQINNINVRYSKSSKYVNCMILPSREFTI